MQALPVMIPLADASVSKLYISWKQGGAHSGIFCLINGFPYRVKQTILTLFIENLLPGLQGRQPADTSFSSIPTS